MILQISRKVVVMLTSQRREEVLVGSDVAERMNRVGCKMMKIKMKIKIKIKMKIGGGSRWKRCV